MNNYLFFSDSNRFRYRITFWNTLFSFHFNSNSSLPFTADKDGSGNGATEKASEREIARRDCPDTFVSFEYQRDDKRALKKRVMAVR